MDDITTATVTAKELGALLNLTPRRIRQLAEQGTFPRAERGRYPLADCIRANVTALERRDDGDELRDERLGLVRAQRRRIELDNQAREASTADLAWQDAMVSAFALVWFLELRPVAGWMYAELLAAGVDNPRRLAGELEGWLVALRNGVEREIKAAAAEARRRQITITDANQLLGLMGRTDEDFSDRPIWRRGEPIDRHC